MIVPLWSLGNCWSLLKEASLLPGNGRLSPLALLEGTLGFSHIWLQDEPSTHELLLADSGVGLQNLIPGTCRVEIFLGGCYAARVPAYPSIGCWYQ